MVNGVVISYGEGGGVQREGGGSEVLLLQKVCVEKVSAMLKGGGHKKCCGSINMGA